MTDPQREDWSRIFYELDQAGITTYVIAKRMRRQFVQVQRMMKAKDLPDWEARFIRALHAESVPGSRFHMEHNNS